MTGYQSKKAAALDEDGMYLVHHTVRDQAIYGTSWTQDGKRIDPMSIYAQPAQEPEYWDVIDPSGHIVASETNAIRGWARIAGGYKPTVENLLGFHDQGWLVLPRATPPTAQPAQEPVCPACKAGVLYECVACSSNNYPPQRPWVGLTEKQFAEAAQLAEDGNYLVAFQRIQQWLKEKNNG
jgi:hypothetical protein